MQGERISTITDTSRMRTLEPGGNLQWVGVILKSYKHLISSSCMHFGHKENGVQMLKLNLKEPSF